MVVGRVMADGNLVRLVFTRANLAASLTSDPLGAGVAALDGGDPPGAGANQEVQTCIMPAAGSIVAVTVDASAAVTTSTATFVPTINGTAISGAALTDLQAVLSATGDTTRTRSQARNKNVQTFVAGDRIGVNVTTTATYAPATLEVWVSVWVGLDKVVDAD